MKMPIEVQEVMANVSKISTARDEAFFYAYYHLNLASARGWGHLKKSDFMSEPEPVVGDDEIEWGDDET